MWYGRKNKYDYAGDFIDNYKSDIRALVARDYNHPSVIMYSIGNEIGEPAENKGVKLAKEMVNLFKSLDSSRAVTGGINLMIIDFAKKGRGIYKEDGSGVGNNVSKKTKKQKASGSLFFNMMAMVMGRFMNNMANSKSADKATTPVLNLLDIAGYNYTSGRYKRDGKLHPERIIYGSETFPMDIVKNWKMVEKFPYLIGDFMWTSWDYLGEAGMGAWDYNGNRAFSKPYPWLLADVGVFDILGNPNGEVYLAQAAWGLLDKPAIAVRPVNHQDIKPSKSVWRGTNALSSWAWSRCDGNKAIVEVYTTAVFVELLLNDKTLGRKKVKNNMVTFNIKYSPGRLTAIAYDNAERETGKSSLSSAYGNTMIRVIPESQSVKPGNVVYIDILLVGENEVVEMNADALLRINVEGGELLAFGSANPCTDENFNTGSYTTYYGRAQAVVRANEEGTINIQVSGNGLTSCKTEIKVNDEQ
jgi:hypothetical protein